MPIPLYTMMLLRRLICCIALTAVSIVLGACSTQTITLSRYKQGDIDTVHMNTMLLAPLCGEASVDAMHLMRHTLGALSPFEIVHHPKYAALTGIDQAIAWAKDSNADGTITASLEVPEIDVARAEATVTGYIAVADVATGRTLLFEPVHHIYRAAEPTPTDDLRLAALQDFVHTFAHRIMPHQERADVMLYTDRALPQSEGAITALIEGDWPTAVDIYRAAIAGMNTWTTPTWVQARLHYNLGTTLGFGGAFDEGMVELQHAQRLAPSDIFEQQIQRLGKYRAEPKQAGSGHRLWRCHRNNDHTPTCVHPFDP